MSYPASVARTATGVSAILTLLSACVQSRVGGLAAPAATSDLTVALTTVPDLAPDRWRGISNIFYSTNYDSVTGPLRESLRMPASWTGAALDDVVRNRELRPVRVMRFRTAADTALQFAIDTTGDGDFTKAPVLSFTRRGRLLVAGIELTVRARTGSQRRVPYQILRSDDGYTYARIAEYRSGRVDVDGSSYAVRVRSASRGEPFYAPNAGTVFLVDLDRDGTFAETASLTVDGRPIAAEQVLASMPFELDGRLYEIVAIDSAGSTLRVRPSNRVVAGAINRRAPELRAKTIAGGEVRLSRQKGKVVLISFWATNCQYSERVRGTINDLVAKHGAKVTWLAIAKDTSRADIAEYLLKSPIHGIATMPDSGAWATYNPAGATPVFVLVDARGIVRFRAEGATAISAVAAKLDQLVSSIR